MVYQFVVQNIEREVLTTTVLGDSGSADDQVFLIESFAMAWLFSGDFFW